MKVIFIPGEEDYDALSFEQSDYDISLETWKGIEEKGYLEIDGDEIAAEALEFGEVDKEFIFFVNNLLDDDLCKTINYYVVEE